jgi:hypothetical protein
MTKSKKIFLAFAGFFILILAIFSYDVSRRTTAPWKKHENSQKEESAGKTDLDSLKTSENNPSNSN